MTIALLLVAACGAVMAVHMICTANFMPRHSPIGLGLIVAGGFAASVGMIVTAVTGNVIGALEFTTAGILALLAKSLYLWFRGYHVCDFVRDKCVVTPSSAPDHQGLRHDRDHC